MFERIWQHYWSRGWGEARTPDQEWMTKKVFRDGILRAVCEIEEVAKAEGRSLADVFEEFAKEVEMDNLVAMQTWLKTLPSRN